MKKLIVLIVLVLALSVCGSVLLTACNTQEQYEIAFIVGLGTVSDKSFNQGAWEGVRNFARAEEKTFKYYESAQKNTEGFLTSIDSAVEAGAKTVVCPGYTFENAVYLAQDKYPQVNFVLLDGVPRDAQGKEKISANVAAVCYAEEEAGFLAGYAVVKDGYRSMGFMGGMVVSAVTAYGYGYLQGMQYAAGELSLGDDSLSAFYHYTGDFNETLTNRETARKMYVDGAEIVFACGGAVGKSVISASQELANRKVIGVDVDQTYDSLNVVTSATKNLSGSVNTVLTAIYAGKFGDYAGKNTQFSAENDGVGLSTRFDRFKIFTRAEFDAVYEKLQSGEIVVVRTLNVASADGKATAQELKNGLGLTSIAITTVD